MQLEGLIRRIRQAKSIVLSTHRECDGDGLGSQIALYHALRKMGKDVRVLNVDPVPPKYAFLEHESFLEVYTDSEVPKLEADLALVFDTNDFRQLSGLYDVLKKGCPQVLFIDHHPPLEEGPAPTEGSVINTAAASTGEMVYDMIKALDVELDLLIARALYTSIAFDTQVFRYIRNSPRSHLIAAELLQYPVRPEEIHQKLFCSHTVEKVKFLSQALGKIEYHFDGKLAILHIHAQDLTDHGLTTEETRDVIDTVMNIESLRIAVLFREDQKNLYKVSLRSKAPVEVLSTAEKLGGGGHRFAAGAHYRGEYQELKKLTLESLSPKLKKRHGPA